MTRDAIITNLFTGKNFNDCIGKMEPEHLREDLKQEIALIICEWPDDRITELYNRNQLEFFVVRTILNQVKSNTSPFIKKYRRQLVELTNKEIADIQYCTEQDDLELRIAQEVENLYWYQAELVKLYLKHGNYRAIQKETRIPYISCYQTIKKSFEELRSKVDPAARVVSGNKNVRA